MARLRTARAARDDIREIRAYSKAAFGPIVARDYLNGLAAQFDLIEARPLVGVLEPELDRDVRSFRYRSHRIYYRPDGDDILVLRVLHQSRDTISAFERE